MAKVNCKVIEALLDILKTLFNVWSVFTLAWAGAFGTLLKNPTHSDLLIFISAFGLSLFALIWVVIVILMVKLATKLKDCEEETQ